MENDMGRGFVQRFMRKFNAAMVLEVLYLQSSALSFRAWNPKP